MLVDDNGSNLKYYQANTKKSDGDVFSDCYIVLLLLVPVKLTNVSDRTVLEGSNTTLFCEATVKLTPV